jgi:hypothetical protein
VYGLRIRPADGELSSHGLGAFGTPPRSNILRQGRRLQTPDGGGRDGYGGAAQVVPRRHLRPNVIVDGERIYGDGVNIAVRVEALAEPGGLAVSGTAFDEVEGKLDLESEDLGSSRTFRRGGTSHQSDPVTRSGGYRTSRRSGLNILRPSRPRGRTRKPSQMATPA